MWRAVSVAMFAVAVSASPAVACAVCYGNPDSPLTKGMAAGIWVMLGCIGFVLAGFAGVFLYWMYRSRHIELYLEEGASN
jgi:hypothetical protein